MPLERIKEIIAERFSVNVDTLNEQTSFTGDLGVDSLEVIELIMALEEEFDISIEDEYAQSMGTIGDVADFIKKKTAGQ